MKKQITLFIAVFIAMFTTTNSFSQLVTSSADDGSDGTLRQEIADTPPGGTITFTPTVTTVTLTMGELLLDKELTITGDVTIDANNNGRVFNISSGPIILNELTLTNGLAADGGAIYIANASVAINNANINNNTANGASGSGGGIFNDVGGVLVVNNSQIISNTANRAGGGIEDNSGAGLGVTLLNVNLDSNNAGTAPATPAPGNGGGFHITGPGDALITGGTCNNNIAGKEGGGLWNGSGTMTVVGTILTGNMAIGNATGGGAFFNNGGILNIDATTTITGNIVSGATPGGRGGGIFNNTGGTLNLASGLTISGNYASRAGGAIEDASNGTLVINLVILSDNSTGVDIGLGNTIAPNPGNGGAIHLSGTTSAIITNTTITGNLAAQEGGGLWNNLGTMIVNGGTIDGNEGKGSAADDGGGGIFNNGGTLTVQNNASITNNIANGTAGSGGGILSIGGDVTVMTSSITTNQANRAGGGIELAGGTLTLSNVTLDMNNAGVAPAVASPGSGGGLHVTGSASTTITGGTTNNNIAANEGGGLWNGSGLMTISNHTVDGNIASGNDAMVAGAAGGGGIYNEGGTLDLSGMTTITNNVADGAQSTGGGILNAAGTLMANGIIIMDNTSNRAGGGIETNGGGAVMLTNVNLNSNDTGVVTGAGAPGNGGGLHVSGNSMVSVTGGTVNMNTAASEGGGLWNGTGTLTVDGAIVDANIASGAGADNGGGGIYALNGGTVNLVNGATISNNIADGTAGSGGGVLVDVDASFSATDSFITGNRSNRAGGGIEIVGGTGVITFVNTALDNNNTGVSPAVAAPGNGGGLHITNSQAVTITGGTVNGNTAGREGGGLWNSVGVMSVDGVMIDANTAIGPAADDGGAGIFNNGGTLNVMNGTMVSNNIASGTSASGGGLLSTSGVVTVSNSTFDSNSANRAGGAIELIAGDLIFNNSIMSNNDVAGTAGTPAPGNGGGFHVTGTTGSITFNTSTITGNSAGNEGGGLWNQNGTTMMVSNSTIDNNSADEGGGIYNNTGSITNVMTSTISGNTATVSGGGLSNNGASLELNAVTVAMNTAATGGGIDAVNNVSLKNSIVALNTAGSGANLSGTLTSNDYNLIGADDLNVFTPQANDLEGVDPVVGPLQDNGGTTLTHQLLAGSPAYDAGSPADNFDDQIGQPVFGANRDVGAYEAQVILGVDEFNDLVSVLKIYPNPTNGQFNIVISDNVTGRVDVQIVSMTGKLVQKFSIGNGVNPMDIAGMASGMYIVNINTENGSTSHKLILN